MAKCFIKYLVFLLFPISIIAQYDNIKFERLNSYKGLATKYVYTILQDDKGFIWFGTANGLYKYDGYKFTGYFHDPGNPKSISCNWVQSLLKDKTGSLWIGTYGGGLNKFDPETGKIIHYIHEPDNSNSLCNNFVMPKHAMYEDCNGNLWIGTHNGLSRIVFPDSLSNSNEPIFTNYYHDSENTTSLSHGMIWSIYEDAESNIWIGTNDGTLHKFETRTEIINQVVTSERLKAALGPKWHKLEGDALVYIGHHPDDPLNILTVALNGYMFKFDYLANKIINHFSNFKELVRKNNLTELNDVLIDQNKKYWIATNMGCYIIKNENQQIYDYHWKQRDPSGLAWKHINTFYEDRQGLIWIGLLTTKGIQKYNPWTQNFKTYVIDTDTSYFIINSIFEETTNGKSTLWIGTARHGIIKLNRTNNQLKEINGDLQYIVTTICQSPNNSNNLFIGTIGKGLFRFNKATNTYHEITYWKYLKENKNAIDYGLEENSIITSLLFDSEGQLWIGSLNGLFKYDEQNNITIAYLHDSENSNSISSNDISALCESNKIGSVIWIGTRTGGLNKLDLKTNCITRYQNIPGDSLTLNNNYISSILEDKIGTLWIGTPVGLNKFDENTNTFIHIFDNDIKLNTEIQSIQEDEQENLWLNTSNGFGKYDKKNNSFNVYTESFKRWAYCKNDKGEFFYGGGRGIVSFFPDKIKYSSYIPPMVLTDFQIFNKSVSIDLRNNSVLNKSISVTKEVILSYDQSVFSFEFALIDFSDPEKNKYAYKMKGVDPDWVYTDASRRFATYTNLDPGEYTFRVKGSNNDGIWNEKGTSIKVIILPPWWKTNWAYLGYIILFGFIVFGVWRFQTNRLKMKQQLEMEHQHAEILEEVDNLKSHFFANISHEFRTPLTLILGPVKQMLSGEFAGNIKEQYKIIVRNGERLLKLINELLDLSKLESGEMKLKVTETDIIQYLKGFVLSFSSLAERKKITLKFKSNESSIIGYIDLDKIEKILTNLLSNAFKFTPEGGHIVVEITKTPTPISPPGRGLKRFPSWEGWPENRDGVCKDFVQITVSNTGSGIPAEQIDKIFDRFYQMDDNYKKDSEGSGIGLALTKELVEVCRGKISVKSEKAFEQTPNLQPPKSPPVGGSDYQRDPFNKGDYKTTFTVLLPVSKEQFKENEIIDTSTEEADSPLKKSRQWTDSSTDEGARGLSETANESTKVEGINLKPKAEKSAPLLLIVEDNPDVTSYICSFMENDYRIVTAENGRTGLQKTLDKYPDLIISDVMMPEMDGFELCHKIKSDERISHIPVILLTAKANLSSKIEGLEFGADDYVTKPFEAKELQIRSKNLIEQRRKLREKFSHLIDLKPEDISASSMDEQLLQRLLAVFEDHIEEPDFTTEEFAREVGLSRMHLNRKLQALTNLSTHDFIRTLRLQRAATLLSNATGTVSEIAYKVGFNNLSHFSKAFHRHFGKLPSEFSSKKN